MTRAHARTLRDDAATTQLDAQPTTLGSEQPTSPDHGVAYGIAGKGEANPASMIAALRLAARIAQVRRDRRLCHE